MKNSLALKFALSVSIIILITSMLLGALFTSIQTRTMEKHLQDKGLSLVQFFADHSEFGLRFHNQEQLQSMVSSLLGQEDLVYATITDAKDAIIINQRSDAASATNLPAAAFSTDSVETIGYRLVTDTNTGDRVYHFSAPITASNLQDADPALYLLNGGGRPHAVRQRIGVAHLGVSLQGMQRAITIARGKLIALMVAIVAAGIVIAILLSMYVTRPIQNLLHATRQIARGDLAVALPGNANDEIGALARSFNTMAETLEQTTVSRELAEHANLAKSEFLANMSHELRTPVHSILSFAELGSEKVGHASAEKLLDYYHEIDQNGRILLRLVNSLLDLSKLEAGKMVFSFEATDLNLLTHSVVEEFRLPCAERRISMHMTSPRSSVLCVTDPDKLRQVVRNILSNALKYSPDGGEIEVVVDECERGAKVIVGDRGPGIPAEEVEDIFAAFVQSSKTKTGAGGTGLGLSISREIIAKHDGAIWAESREGGGACFCFEIPRCPRRLSAFENDRILNEAQVVQKSL